MRVVQHRVSGRSLVAGRTRLAPACEPAQDAVGGTYPYRIAGEIRDVERAVRRERETDRLHQRRSTGHEMHGAVGVHAADHRTVGEVHRLAVGPEGHSGRVADRSSERVVAIDEVVAVATGQDAYRATNGVDPLDRQVVGVGDVDETVGPDRDRCRPPELRPGRGAGQDGDRWTGVGRWRDQPRHSDDRHQGEHCKRRDRHQLRRNLHPAPGRRYKRHADCWPSGVPDGDLGSAVDSELFADVLQVTVDRALRNEQAIRDRPVGQALGDEGGDLLFSPTQRGAAGHLSCHP